MILFVNHDQGGANQGKPRYWYDAKRVIRFTKDGNGFEIVKDREASVREWQDLDCFKVHPLKDLKKFVKNCRRVATGRQGRLRGKKRCEPS